jgi:hypothetical protein
LNSNGILLKRYFEFHLFFFFLFASMLNHKCSIL